MPSLPQRKRSRSPSHSATPTSRQPRSESASPTSGSSNNNTNNNNNEAFFLDPSFSNFKGDIYLKIENTLFPCSCEKLGNAGGFFSALFSIPQPNDTDLIHGLPHCDMPDCTVDDLRPLLQLIHGFEKVFWNKTEGGRYEFNLDNILGVLRLSVRFDLADCRLQAAQAVRDFVNCTLGDIAVEGPTLDVPCLVLVGHNLHEDLAMCRLSFRMINIFHESQLPQFLPYAYYLACQQPVDIIMDGVDLPNGTRECLTVKDIKKILNGKHSLRRLRREHTFGWLTQLANYRKESYAQLTSCISAPECHEFTCSLRDAFFQPGSSVLEDRYDALASMSASAWTVVKNHVCLSCQKQLMYQLGLSRCESWERLPLMFGDQTWAELKSYQKKLDEEWMVPIC
ncbi:hypothetical protein D9757_005651 [Collybiopsis confluens]|uniref:Uncharacterized protein n=1 Tax=Collybiopsis confluens TaxID=2823264 RepID=A0A8H5HSP6_9AGAR|nr:hypothetical protein D9757_005651 [Collybiopsis confluens]